MTIEELRGKRIGILGFGLNNQELVKFLVDKGIPVIVREKNPARKQAFEKAYPDLAPKVSWQIGPKTLDKLQEFGVVFRSPVIPFLSRELQQAIKQGVQVYSQTKLFFDLCPAPIIAVTGTKGKGTTASLIHAILKAGYHAGNVYLAGNIGVDPFEFYHRLTPNDVVILELSSFQIQDLHKSPHIAVILSVGVDHLDHHQSIAEYREAKRALLTHQSLNDSAIINTYGGGMDDFIGSVRGKLYTYNRHTPKRESAWADQNGDQETIFVQIGNQLESFDSSNRKLTGEHNLDNILPAVLVGTLYNVEPKVMAQAVQEFTGLPHRLSLVGTYNGVQFYDDSYATNTPSTEAALAAFPGKRIHLIAGGNEKEKEYVTLAKTIAKHCVTVSLLPGSATKKLLPELRREVRTHRTLQILENAREPLFPTILSGIQPHLKSGDVVLLSPAASSFASFTNAGERGDFFVRAVRERYDKATS